MNRSFHIRPCQVNAFADNWREIPIAHIEVNERYRLWLLKSLFGRKIGCGKLLGMMDMLGITLASWAFCCSVRLLKTLVDARSFRGAERIVDPSVPAVTVAVEQIVAHIVQRRVGNDVFVTGVLSGLDAVSSIEHRGVVQQLNPLPGCRNNPVLAVPTC
jgi:hypothetical protein